MSQNESEYGLSPDKKTGQIEPPPVTYRPRQPKAYNPPIGLIGAGGISEFHLKAYKAMGLNVVAIANRTLEKAEKRRNEFYPDADVTTDYKELLRRDDIEVVDVTPHPDARVAIVADALEAGKHVLSQKPFAEKLEDGQRLVDLAAEKGLKLAVNQNGRWAPHFAYMRNAIADGIIGKVVSVNFSLQWDQTWIAGIPAFESIKHMVLADFAIHWFDITHTFMRGHRPQSVYAAARAFEGQLYRPPALAGAIINYESAQVTMSFNAHTTLGEEDTTTVVGTKGTLRSTGPGLNDQPRMQLFLNEGRAVVDLDGCWFDSGFIGTMGELLCAIEEKREPDNSAADVMQSLALCFHALKSADEGKVVSLA